MDWVAAAGRPLAPRVLLVEDHPLFLNAVRDILARHFSGFALSCATSVDEAMLVLDAAILGDGRCPTAILCDLHLPDSTDSTWFARLRARTGPATHIAVLSAEHDTTLIAAALHDGANSFISKTLGVDALLDQFSAVLGAPANQRGPLTPDALHFPSDFSARQMAVAKVLVKGQSNKEIARTLGLGPETIKSHVSEIIAKLGARNRTEAVSKLTGGAAR